MTKRLLLAFAAVLALLIPAAPAWAHNALAEATPAKNATLKKAPTSVELRFLEKLNADDTELTITGESGAQIPRSGPKVSGATVSTTFPPLSNGKYTVSYRVASHDGHVTNGSYKFTVAAPVSSAAPVASAAPSSGAAPSAETPPAATASAEPAVTVAAQDDGDGGGPWLGLAAGIGILALAGAAGFVLVRRRRAAG